MGMWCIRVRGQPRRASRSDIEDQTQVEQVKLRLGFCVFSYSFLYQDIEASDEVIGVLGVPSKLRMR